VAKKKYYNEIEAKRKRMNLMRLYWGIGVLFLFGFFYIDNSETVNHYLDLASKDPSGFRFLLFMGIIKFGALVIGITLFAATSIYFVVRKIKN
jgi:hypothetical protein